MTPPEDTGAGTVSPEDTGTITVTAFDGLGSGVKVQSLPLGAPESDVTLPATLGASGYTVADDAEPVPTHIQIEGVTWELTGEKDSPTAYEEGREKPCNYYFQRGTSWPRAQCCPKLKCAMVGGIAPVQVIIMPTT